jgi:hypothetical protein
MLKRNLFFLFFITIFAFLSVILCISNYNPFKTSLIQFIYFYSSFFVTVAGISSIIIFYIKIVLQKKETIYIHFWPAVRQGLIVSLGLSVLLILKGLKLLDFWVGIPIIIIILLLELFFQTKKLKTSIK